MGRKSISPVALADSRQNKSAAAPNVGVWEFLRWLRRRSLAALPFALIAVLAATVVYDRIPRKAEQKAKYSTVHHYIDKPAILHVPNGPKDACRIMPSCFHGKMFGSEKSCQYNMALVLQAFDSSAIYDEEDGGKLVGFITFHREVDPDDEARSAILIYNICVDEQRRGQGLATQMIREGTDEMVNHYGLKDKRVLLGLDVELPSPMAAEAFSLYAKLGFLRAWQPCISIGDLDWRPLYKNPSSQSVASHLPQVLESPERYIERILSGKETPQTRLPSRRNRPNDPNKPFYHFCMYRWYGEDLDGFRYLGRKLKAFFANKTLADSYDD